MNVLQINGYESPGRRFNGLSITKQLESYGINSRHFIWQKDTENPEILTLNGKWTKKINKLAGHLEAKLSLQSILYPHASQIMRLPAFKEADLIHLHIIHSGYFSLCSLPKLTRLKPTVWTLHDPWAMTGHCIYPMDCQRWKIGCGKCPDLKVDFSLLRDNTRLLFDYKRIIYKKSKFDIIVASKWMQNMVENSPLFEDKKIHLVPFGIDLNFFTPLTTQSARQRFNISNDTIVICFRALNTPFKGLPYILAALEKIKTHQRICLLTLNCYDTVKQFADKFQIIELGWSNDQVLVRDALAASDIFLMPSTAEAFGMMAIEALACAKPVVVFDVGSLPEVTFAPSVGLSVPARDSGALATALTRLIDNPDERQNRGQKGRKIAEQFYSDELYSKRIAQVYEEVSQR